MLACYPQRRQHLHLPPTDLPSPSPSHTDFFDLLSHTTCTPSPSDFNLRNYFTSGSNIIAPITDSDSILDSSGAALNNSLMNSFDYSNPSIRVQGSTPVPTSQTFDWNLFGDNTTQSGSNASLHTPSVNGSGRSHRRAPSASSIGSDYSSASANASHAHATQYGSEEHSGRFAKQTSLPTPTQTPTQDTFLSPTYPNFSNSQGNTESNNMAAHFALKQALHDKYDEDMPGFAPSSRHSVSSYGHNSPATPHDNDYDDSLKLSNDSVPSVKYENMPDIFGNSNQQMFGSSLPRIQNQSMNRLQPHVRLQDRLNAANATRSQSPASSISRAVSPFCQNSPYAGPQTSFGSPHQRIGTVSALREQQQQPDPNSAMKTYKQEEPKTISPKDALLDYENSEDSKMPLFPENETNSFNPQYRGDQFAAQSYDNASNQSFTGLANSRRENWNSGSQPMNGGFATSDATANFNFVAPALPNGLPTFPQQHYRPTSNMQSAPEPTPEFPAHLTSMESSISDAGGPDNNFEDIQRPETTSAGRGTYSCTYHGCPLRFETPQKLQKHKREGHRQNIPTAPTTTGVGSGMSSAELLQRNSQAGPHKCTRINPTTGKPCNTEFSRPYDLTRHEDTIHNNRKQKVRCALCVEDKTFSRSDALTRHMRVVHPDVDFPGKHRRRGGHD